MSGHEFVRRGEREMRRIEGDLNQEGLSRVSLLDLANRLVGQQISRVAFFFERPAIALPVDAFAALAGVFEIIDLSAHEAIEMIKAMLLRRMRAAEVPFADE